MKIVLLLRKFFWVIKRKKAMKPMTKQSSHVGKGEHIVTHVMTM